MPLELDLPELSTTRLSVNRVYREDEKETVLRLLAYIKEDETRLNAIESNAHRLVSHIREARQKSGGIDAFMQQYSLSSTEGIALMCLAEALLRVPDKKTIDELIKDKILNVDWATHLGQSKSFFVNATTWALMLTGSVFKEEKEKTFKTALKGFIGRSSEGVIRRTVAKAMQIMSRQFVMGRDVNEALKRSRKAEARGYCYSYDMLGEAAITDEDAVRYFNAYDDAIDKIGKASQKKDIYKSPSISVKLSALYPRYEVAHYHRAVRVLSERLLSLCQKAKHYNIALTVDAEEADRLDMSLDVFERVYTHTSLDNWLGMGLALQSYQKRAFFVIDYLAELAKRHSRRIMVRLIKGAYWDTEIKRAQMDGLEGYPVFTSKVFTDVSFQACAKKIFTLTDVIYPKIATHNAYSVAYVLSVAGNYRDFEFQCLHGMGSELYDEVVGPDNYAIPCRIYAPVGGHADLLPYLVRRLLENGANSSFVNRIVDDKAPIEKLIEPPMKKAERALTRLNAHIPLPCNIFLPRVNSRGLDVSNIETLSALQQSMREFSDKTWQAHCLVGNSVSQQEWFDVSSPNNTQKRIGQVAFATDDDVTVALNTANEAHFEWSRAAVEKRAECLLAMGRLLEDNCDELISLLMLEAGKTLNDAINEIREAVDFCRYYADRAVQAFSQPTSFTGYTGEIDELHYLGRGIMLCISPWNFPLAIFLGQISAALVAGNTVIAKPAEQTSLIAFFAVKLFYKAGIPKNALQLLLGDGQKVAAPCVESEDVKGVLFTGSTLTAKLIQQSLAKREGEIVPLIAETGGQNVMIVDSSALLEQVVSDILMSAFGSAGQRCSALRVAYIQHDIFDKFEAMLKGAMAKLVVGESRYLETDVGPVIDKEQQAMLQNHIEAMQSNARLIYQTPKSKTADKGYYIQPCAFEIKSIDVLTEEHFGPILHVVRFAKERLDEVINDINSTGYGLTLGIHSRIDSVAEYIATRVNVGNVYVNRNMIGAVVGLQPFGGEGLSGTGPKAGGPNYLHRLVKEKTITIDTTAAGGNASLMTQEE